MPAETKSGNTTIEFHLSPSLKKKLKARAKKQNVSLSQLMRDASQKYLKEVN